MQARADLGALEKYVLKEMRGAIVGITLETAS
jgi:hypothetical protein